jgi:hypothetical protein
MIDWLILYGIFMGLLLRMVNHHRLVVAGHSGRGVITWVLSHWVRGMIIVFIIIQGFHLYWLWPDCYNVWWNDYFVEHSPMAFALVTVPVTIVLYLLKEITFRVARDPIAYELYDPGTGRPTLLRTSMGMPMIWFTVYWAWILFSPWLPFYTCFIKGCLLGGNNNP